MPGPRNKININDVRNFSTDKLKAVQMDLRSRGLYKGKIDGVYGPATEKAVQGYNMNQIVGERTLPEADVTGRKQHKYKGCVEGICYDYAEKNSVGVEKFRKSNNLYGDA